MASIDDSMLAKLKGTLCLIWSTRFLIPASRVMMLSTYGRATQMWALSFWRCGLLRISRELDARLQYS